VQVIHEQHVTEQGVRQGVAAARARIEAACRRAGRDPASVHVVAATKYVGAAAVSLLAGAGVRDVAENRLDALEAKQAAADAPGVAWHYIGRLQSRKVAAIAPRVDAIHTLASVSAAERLAALADGGAALPTLLVQVNVADDPSKDGVAAGDLDRFLEGLPQPLAVAGLMTMPAFAEEGEGSRPAFAALRELAAGLARRHEGRHGLGWLSMGTSQDYEVAVEEGATHVRLGRILYAGQEYVPR
jgi:PLP dependent protein